MGGIQGTWGIPWWSRGECINFVQTALVVRVEGGSLALQGSNSTAVPSCRPYYSASFTEFCTYALWSVFLYTLWNYGVLLMLISAKMCSLSCFHLKWLSLFCQLMFGPLHFVINHLGFNFYLMCKFRNSIPYHTHIRWLTPGYHHHPFWKRTLCCSSAFCAFATERYPELFPVVHHHKIII